MFRIVITPRVTSLPLMRLSPTTAAGEPTNPLAPCVLVSHVPLSAAAVERIVKAVEPFEYDRLYGAFWDAVIERDGKAAVARSAERYRRAISGP